MSLFASSCGICGARTDPGKQRCGAHANGSGQPTSCVVCGTPTIGSHRCAAHPETEVDRRRRFPYRAKYAEAEYTRNRTRAIERAAGRCENALCRKEIGPHSLVCDHILPLSRGGNNDLDNLQTMCHACHNTKTRADRAARRERAL